MPASTSVRKKRPNTRYKLPAMSQAKVESKATASRTSPKAGSKAGKAAEPSVVAPVSPKSVGKKSAAPGKQTTRSKRINEAVEINVAAKSQPQAKAAKKRTGAKKSTSKQSISGQQTLLLLEEVQPAKTKRANLPVKTPAKKTSTKRVVAQKALAKVEEAPAVTKKKESSIKAQIASKPNRKVAKQIEQKEVAAKPTPRRVSRKRKKKVSQASKPEATTRKRVIPQAEAALKAATKGAPKSRSARKKSTSSRHTSSTHARPPVPLNTSHGVKATKRRAPDDLAEQYTDKPKRRRPSKAEASLNAARAARRTAEEKERLNRLMNPSDEILNRLARIGAISTTLATSDDEANPEPRRRRTLNGAATRRPRRWESACGKCGHKGQFTSSAGVCARCGAIAVRI